MCWDVRGFLVRGLFFRLIFVVVIIIVVGVIVIGVVIIIYIAVDDDDDGVVVVVLYLKYRLNKERFLHGDIMQSFSKVFRLCRSSALVPGANR